MRIPLNTFCPARRLTARTKCTRIPFLRTVCGRARHISCSGVGFGIRLKGSLKCSDFWSLCLRRSSLWTWPAWGVAGLSSGDTPTNRQSHSHTDCFHSVRPVLVWLANAHHSTQITPHLLSKKCEFHIYTVQIELMWLKGNGPINLRRLQQ